MAHQSLYLQYRPRRFAEVKGQDHVVGALQSAVRNQKVGHAYLLHGPRGSGKTSTARVLAKALNCENLEPSGEPCCECESCVSIHENRSFDLQELDAASNNKVDDMRTLLERVNLATPGRAKVYLLDEVHMLTTGAENALLKTLEEPPSHVTWVLATTEPHKVAQTIRSRCQVFELGLLNADLLTEHVRFVVADGGLDVDEDGIRWAVAAGAGSVRDTLSALDRVAAGGASVELDSSTDEILEAIADSDARRALTGINSAVMRGRDPRTISEHVLAGLRDAFLASLGDLAPRLSEHEQQRATSIAQRVDPSALTRAMETLGRALIDMRSAPDPRIDIEIALVRLCQPRAENTSLEALQERLEHLEAQVERLTSQAPQSSSASKRTHRPSRSQAPPPPPPRQPAPLPPRTSAPSGNRGRPNRQPAKQAREALGPRRMPPGGRSRHKDSGTPSKPPPVGRPSRTPPPVVAADPAMLSPGSAKEVVELAERHLGMTKQAVVTRANELLPPRRGAKRSREELRELWIDLVKTWRKTQTPQEPPQQTSGESTPAGSTPAGSTPAPSSPESPGSHDSPSPKRSTTSSPAPLAPPQVTSTPPTSSSLLDAGDQAKASARGTTSTSNGQIAADEHLDAEEEEIAASDLDDLLEDFVEAPDQHKEFEAAVLEMFPGSRIEVLSDREK